MANEGSVERWAVKVSGGVAFYCEARILPRGKRRGNLCIMEKGSANFSEGKERPSHRNLL